MRRLDIAEAAPRLGAHVTVLPYGPDLAAFFANFNAVFKGKDEAGIHYARLMVHINEASLQSPLKTSLGAVYYNPIPKAGAGSLPGPFKGPYPHVERDGN